nr:MAG TPA: hypothetical protein [Caudoviricetes sp.]
MCTCFLRYGRHLSLVYVWGGFLLDFVFFGDLAV